METGLSVRQVQPSTGAAAYTEIAANPRSATRTELPQTQAVAPVAEPEPVQYDQTGEQQKLRAKLNSAIDAFEGRPTIKVEQDEVTRDLVFRKVSPRTGAVVQQFPDEAVLRQRAYAAQQRRAELEQELMGTQAQQEEHVYRMA